MRHWLPRVLIVLLVVGGAGAFLLWPAERAASQSGVPVYLDLDVPPAGWNCPQIPPNCVTWHELWPNNCAPHHQDRYIDNGDGVISPCDYILLNNKWFHIEWVGPTYFMTCIPPGGGPPVPGFIAEPQTLNPTADPYCETWHWIWPPERHCQPFHIDSYHPVDPNVPGIKPCDIIDTYEPDATGQVVRVDYHIDRIGCNIRVVPGDPPPTKSKSSSWGWLKQLFR